MEVALRVSTFPIPSIVWVTVVGIPSTCVMPDLDKI
jgi:hypothetical protein